MTWLAPFIISFLVVLGIFTGGNTMFDIIRRMIQILKNEVVLDLFLADQIGTLQWAFRKACLEQRSEEQNRREPRK